MQRRERRHREKPALLLEALEPRTLLNGLTIITHGAEVFSGLGSTSRPGWIEDMGNAIAKRLGGNTPIYTLRVEPGSGGVGGVKVTKFSRLSGAATSADSTSGQTILLLDWASASAVNLLTLSADYSAASVAAVTMPYLTAAFPAAGITAPLAEGAIQIIGHSRGGSVVSELAKQLGQQGIWVEQVTTLDPRPVPPDPGVSLKSNVIFSDNYYQTSGDGFFTPNGMSISGAANFGPLSVPGGYGSTHSNIPLFYQGTIDGSAAASLEGNTVPASWYAGNNVSRTTGGFYFSAMGGGASVRPVNGISTAFGGTGARSSLTRAGNQWADIGTLVPSSGQVTTGQAFAATFRYNSYAAAASVQWFLDPDNNPYNKNAIALGDAQALAATGDTVVKTTAALTVGNVAAGNYFLVGRISNATGTRYAYSGALAVAKGGGPIGSLDVAGPAALLGWAVDTGATGAAVNVRVDVDGAAFATAPASVARPDLAQAFGSANHGFSVSLASLSVGTHRVDVYAYDARGTTPTLLASRTISTNRPPLGSIDWFDGAGLAGWAYDADVPGTSIQVRYSIDNGAPSFLPTSQDRVDVGAVFGTSVHGYAVYLPQLTAGPHTATVFAVDPLTQALTPLGSRTVTVASPGNNALPTGNVELINNTQVAGWAYDPTIAAAAISVRVDVDGVAGTPLAAATVRADLSVLPGGSAHAFSQTLTLPPGQHRIDVYAYDLGSNVPVLLASRIVTSLTAPAMRGSIDVVNGTQIIGWAFDPNAAAAGATSAVVRIDIDGLPGAAAYTTGPRSDITNLFGTGNWAYSAATPALTPGAHTVTLVVIDPVTLNSSVVATRTLTVS